ncbi:alpha/beta-hydrolase [Diplogelasinospora grovesii]|uniref:Alpha/beta-hydrolase n=1 Tax=Diplogelasinospora grovesii TaxID=303347 RepID=A0AAN6N8P5_9PEZI|nr:alpha/beta-hydrolase [Diplogelasinospora grovesii]
MAAPNSTFPAPIVVEPVSGTHRQTFILLHGRGSSADKFGPVLLDTPITSTDDGGKDTVVTLATAFPHAKFIFPTAPRSRATVYNRSRINQWFDCWHVDAPRAEQEKREWLMIDGLQETVGFVHGLLQTEIASVGAENVVLGGLSQGCAASLTGLLLWEGEKIGACVGMCGWVPFLKSLTEAVPGAAGYEDGEDNEDDPFERSDPEDQPDDDAAEEDVAVKAVRTLREKLEMDDQPSLSGRPAVFETPIFLGHGTEDDRVPIDLGRDTERCLGAMGLGTSWIEYGGLGHWYSGAMLAHMVQFLRTNTNWGQTKDEGA